MPGVITDTTAKHGTALLIVDMINAFDYEDGAELFENAVPAAEAIAELKRKCVQGEVPAIYVNDNFHKWHNSFASTIDAVEEASTEGRRMVSLLRPNKEDYYVLKPHRSGFYKTPLGLLLSELEVSRVILTGVTTDMCILHTGQDAYIRGFELVVPGDCTAALRQEYHSQSLEILKRTGNADTRDSAEIRLDRPDPVESNEP
jgi:nicotinamidase-related amidase